MTARRGHFLGLRIPVLAAIARVLATALLSGLISVPVMAQAQTTPLLLRPDSINFDRLCRISDVAPPPTEDWRLWDEQESEVGARRLIEISRFYSRPNLTTPNDPPTAERLLRVAMKAQGVDGRDAKAELGRLMTDGDSGLTDRPKGVILLREAYRAGDVGLAVVLARVLANDETLREPDESIEAYIDVAIANRSAEAPILYAQLLDRGILPARAGFERVPLVNQALLFLLDDLQEGRCDVLPRFGAIYRDRLFAEHFNLDLAADWYRAGAATRDPRRALSALRLAEMMANAELAGTDPDDVTAMLERAYGYGSVDAAIRLANRLTNLPVDAPKRTALIAIAGRLAALDVTDGLSLMARLSAGDFGDPVDQAATIEMLRRLVLRHDAPAFALEKLARALLDGRGVEADPAAARALYERALELGSEDAALALARIHLEGIGVTADIPLGIRYLRRSADTNSGAAAQLASFHRCGIFVGQDLVLGAFWTNRALMLGETAVISRITDRMLESGNPADLQERVDLLLVGDRTTGSRRARSMLAAAYERGLGVTRDDARASAWFLKAIESGDDQGIGLMQAANRHLEFPGGIAGVELALPLLEKGVAIKDPAATYRYGQLLLSGAHGIPKDAARGRALLRQSAELGHPTGMREHALQLTAPGERAEQLAWLRRAAADADGPAVEALIERQPDLPDAMRVLQDFEYRMPCDAPSVYSVVRAYDLMTDPAARAKRDAWIERAEALFPEDPRLPLRLGLHFKERDPQDAALAIRMLEAAVRLNQQDARLHLAVLHLDTGSTAADPARGAALRDGLVAEATADDAWRLHKMAADLKLAPEQRDALLSRAVDGGVPAAMQLMGSTMITDDADATIRAQGVALLERAAARDDMKALNMLAIAARVGLSGPVDLPKYLTYTRRMAELGDRRAMIDLAVALETGLGGAVDAVGAARWRAAAGSTAAVNAVLEAIQ
ncbi:MAG: hypothetical protein MUC58_09265 [Rhizobiaceae bacterium]|jgi:TPR repeat protein|nr:hypothetical protein [Rhizobiaceae bacterium]